MSNKVVVIGGGVAGLSAGVYARKCGFDVTILESHSIPGGNCTSWKRGGYLFEGGMHWLTGSDKKQPLHKCWRYVGALDDSVVIHTPEPFIEYDHKGTNIRLYRDTDKTEKHWLELSPADAKAIKDLCNNIRRVRNLAMPVFDLRGVKVTKKSRPSLSLLFGGLSAVLLMRRLAKSSRDEFINSFTHEGLRGLLRSNTTEKSGILPICFSMGIISSGDGGFPEGGSLPFAGRIADTFTELGGEIRYKTRADRIIIENGKAVGVMVGADRLSADAVIVTADTMAIDHLFDVPPKADWLDEMRSMVIPTMCVFVSIGVNADLSKYPKSLIFKLNKPITIADQTYEHISVNNYASDPVYSPVGKTAMTVILDGDTYDYWKMAREDGRYVSEKQRVADEVIAALSVQMPEMEGLVEVSDVATPLTYERYCANWKGSWMTDMTPSTKMKSYPAVVDGLSGVYFAGHRMQPPGGLPVALITGRSAVQHLCRDTGTLFVSEE